MPVLDDVEVLVFAGNHGVVARGVSPYPATVTTQMVANFAAGGAAINQLARHAGATLRVIPLQLDTPTADIVTAPAMTTAEFAAALDAGYAAVRPGTSLLCLGEMGIGNTTAAAALCTALFGGEDWTGLGTGIDPDGLQRKRAAVHDAAVRHAGGDALELLRCLGGRELAAIAGAIVAARHLGVPVLLDGFVCTSAAAPLAVLQPGALDHCLAAHVSAEAAHRRLLRQLDLPPLLDFGMRLGRPRAPRSPFRCSGRRWPATPAWRRSRRLRSPTGHESLGRTGGGRHPPDPVAGGGARRSPGTGSLRLGLPGRGPARRRCRLWSFGGWDGGRPSSGHRRVVGARCGRPAIGRATRGWACRYRGRVRRRANHRAQASHHA